MQYMLYYRKRGEETSVESFTRKDNALNRAEFLVGMGYYDIHVNEERTIFKYYAEENKWKKVYIKITQM